MSITLFDRFLTIFKQFLTNLKPHLKGNFSSNTLKVVYGWINSETLLNIEFFAVTTILFSRLNTG